jgi:hypothetical protein
MITVIDLAAGAAMFRDQERSRDHGNPADPKGSSNPP